MKMQIVKGADTRKGSSPVYDEEILKAAAKCQPRPKAYEVSLQKLTGTELYQWHSRALNSVYWYGQGEAMEIADEH